MIAYLRPVLHLPSLPVDAATLRFAAELLGWWLLGFCTTGLVVWLTA